MDNKASVEISLLRMSPGISLLRNESWEVCTFTWYVLRNTWEEKTREQTDQHDTATLIEYESFFKWRGQQENH